ncbi:MotA/TolQ/ExbB proton channel family protein [Gluconacetobacter johannae DSM 13595]|uniref:Flagellar motor protein MotA n=1 Tax=Gluconacetobacter johannae TaxID=112140 RepID=A0A7W4P3L1_9PROT|nr:flagellar motor protein MotA [Gluconacetobacter johannae]MBB2176261.1 flagellar motor protein MotA [Gluconacetobacter johannae]GBQ90681.1 MotA/TolQ/ExbB proton channel family protein [Gluconacetobacter johannae DSM 13595]
MTHPTTYILRIALFMAAVLLVAATLWRTLYSAFFNNPVLDGLILGILAFGIAWNVRMVLRLIPEVRWVETLRQPRAGLAQPTPPKLLAPMASMLATRNRTDRLVLSTPAMQSMLDSLSSRLDEGRELSRYMTGLLIFLGLLGTFYGLLLTVGSIADVIGGLSVGAADLNVMFDQLKTGLAQPLHGMGTAFSGSMFGLAGALVLGFLDLTAGQAQNRFFNELEEWLAGLTRISPALANADGSEAGVPAYVQALLEQTAENLEKLQNLIARGEDGRIQQQALLGSLNERIGTMTDTMRASHALMQRMADDSAQGHLRGIEMLLTRMLSDMEQGRNQVSTDIRNDLRLLARTVAAAAPAGARAP